MGDQWVRLPKGAQVTMSRDQVRAYQGVGFMGKAVIAALIIGVLWLFGHDADSNKGTDNKPHPTPTHSAPRTVGE